MKVLFPLCATALLWISSPYLLSQASQASQGDPSQKEVITSYEYQAFLNAASLHEELAQIFYTDLLRKPGSQMDAALDSHFDLGSRDTYSPASKCSPALPHQPSQPPRRDQYEISGLESTLKNSSDYYDEKMALNQGMGSLPIYRLGTPGNYSYELLQEEEHPKKPLLFLSIQEAEQFCRWKNLPPTALHPTFPQMDRMLQTTQNSFSLSEEGAASQQAIIEEEAVDGAVGTTFDILFEELLGIAVLSAGVSHSYHPRDEETFRTRQEHSVIQQNPASSGTPYSPLRSRAGSEEEPAAKRPRLLDPSGLGEGSTLGKRSFLFPEDFNPSNKSQNRGSSSSSSSIAIQNATHDQHTTSDMTSKKEAAQRTHFRLGENSISKGLDVVFQKYNRANPGDAIDKKKSAYQKELDDLNQSDPSSKRAILLSKLLPLCEQARDYQYKIVGHLLKVKEKREEKKGEVSNKVTSLACATLENVIQLNDAPNAVERLITQIEKDEEALCRSQELSARIQLKTTARIAAGDDPSIKLLEVQKLINNSVAGYNQLIDARIASAKSLKPPYEKEGTQESEHVGTETSETSKEKKNLYLYEFRTRGGYYSARRELLALTGYNPITSIYNTITIICNKAFSFITTSRIKSINRIEEVATTYLQAVNFLEKAATARASGKEKEAEFWDSAGKAYFKLAREQAKANAKRAVVESLTQAANYYEKAATARASGKDKEAEFLNDTGSAYFNLAKELDKANPNQDVVESLTQATNYYEKAAHAEASGDKENAQFLYREGKAYFKLAEELAKPGNKCQKDVKERWKQAAGFRAKATAEKDNGNSLHAEKWNALAKTFQYLSKELVRDDKNPAVVESLTQAANYYERAAQAMASGKDKEADYWNSAGNYFKNAAIAQASGKDEEALYLKNTGKASERLAEEQAKANPSTAVVEGYTEAADYYKNAAIAQASGKDKEALYLNNAGHAYCKLAIELDKPTPRQAMVKGYTEAADYYKNAAIAQASGKDKEALYLNNAGNAYCKLAIEQAKANPSTAVVESYTQAANYFKNAATARASGKEKEADYWNSAGIVYVKIANKQAKDSPSQAVVESYTQAVDYYKKAAQAMASGKDKEADYWNSEGNNLYWAAQETQKTDTENRALSDRFGMDMVQFHEGARDAFDEDYVGTLFNDAAQAYRSSISAEKSGDDSAAKSWHDIGNHYRDAAKACKDFLEKNNLTPQDSRLDAFLDQSIEGGRTIKARLEDAIRLSNQLGKSKT